MDVVNQQFQRAVQMIKDLPKVPREGDPEITISNQNKLDLYGLYKQATEGDCNEPKPGMFELIKKYKHEAWKKREGLSDVDAKRKYLDTLLQIISDAPQTNAVNDWKNKLVHGDKKNSVKEETSKNENNVTKQSSDNIGNKDKDAKKEEKKPREQSNGHAQLPSNTPNKAKRPIPPLADRLGIGKGQQPITSTPLHKGRAPPPYAPHVDDAPKSNTTESADDDEIETFHDSVDQFGDPGQGGDEDRMAAAITQLERELNATKNRVRELEFRTRSHNSDENVSILSLRSWHSTYIDNCSRLETRMCGIGCLALGLQPFPQLLGLHGQL
eukprot:m.166125 g.166125  ORF g.166125 m.166125 type:complete len:327 (-) comp15271_c1_seq2:1520-2500(-)